MTRIPLKMLLVRNPTNRKTEIPRYKFKPKSHFESVLRDTEKSKLLDMIDLGGVVSSVETVVYHCLSLFLPPAYSISFFLTPLAEIFFINTFKIWKNRLQRKIDILFAWYDDVNVQELGLTGGSGAFMIQTAPTKAMANVRVQSTFVCLICTHVSKRCLMCECRYEMCFWIQRTHTEYICMHECTYACMFVRSFLCTHAACSLCMASVSAMCRSFYSIIHPKTLPPPHTQTHSFIQTHTNPFLPSRLNLLPKK